jgi:hypothetical protein
MTRLSVKLTQWPEQVTQPGRYNIQSAKPPQETRFGSTLILIVTNAKGQQGSLFVPFAPETTEQTNLGRLVKAFGEDTDQWIGKQLDVTLDESGKRTIRPVVK